MNTIDVRITFDRELTDDRTYTTQVFADQLDELLTGRKALPRPDVWGMGQARVAGVAPITTKEVQS